MIKRRISVIALLTAAVGVSYLPAAAVEGPVNSMAMPHGFGSGSSGAMVSHESNDPPPVKPLDACKEQGYWACGLSTLGIGGLSKDPYTSGIFGLACPKVYDWACNFDDELRQKGQQFVGPPKDAKPQNPSTSLGTEAGIDPNPSEIATAPMAPTGGEPKPDMLPDSQTGTDTYQGGAVCSQGFHRERPDGTDNPDGSGRCVDDYPPGAP